MSEVKRYFMYEVFSCPLDIKQWVTDADFDATQSELAALREELASAYQSFDKLADIVGFSEERLQQTGGSPMDCAIQLKQRLADAERRNAELLDLLRDIKDAPGGSSFRKHIEAALTKPEEAKS